MAKKKKGYKSKGIFSGRYGNPRALWTYEGQRMARKNRKLKKKNRKKYNKKRRIARYLSDGKITKSEARKLIKRGISMDKVLNQTSKR